MKLIHRDICVWCMEGHSFCTVYKHWILDAQHTNTFLHQSIFNVAYPWSLIHLTRLFKHLFQIERKAGKIFFNFHRCVVWNECELLSIGTPNPDCFHWTFNIYVYCIYNIEYTGARVNSTQLLMHTFGWFYIVWFQWIENSIHQKSYYYYLGCSFV